MANNQQPNPDYEHDRTDVSGVHAPVAREKGDPGVSSELPSLWVFAVCGLILMLGTGIFMGHLYAPSGDIVDQRPTLSAGAVEEDPALAFCEAGKKSLRCLYWLPPGQWCGAPGNVSTSCRFQVGHREP